MVTIKMVSAILSSDTHILRLSNFARGSYRFTQDLLQLELASPSLQSLPYHSSIASPLRPAAWDRALYSIPDKAFTTFLLRGITRGFRIGVKQGALFTPTRRNRSSAYERPDVIAAYLAREVELSRMTPLPSTPSLAPPLPKKNKPNKWRLIVDLSSPEGFSINDAISEDLCSVSYASLDHAVRMAKSMP